MTRIRQRTEVMDRIYRTRLGIQVLINAVTVHVGTGTALSGLPTNQELAGAFLKNAPSTRASYNARRLLLTIQYWRNCRDERRSLEAGRALDCRLERS